MSKKKSKIITVFSKDLKSFPSLRARNYNYWSQKHLDKTQDLTRCICCGALNWNNPCNFCADP